MKPATATVSLEDEIHAIWCRPISRLPVYKDLPRLAGRCTVNITTLKKIQAVDKATLRRSVINLEALKLEDKPAEPAPSLLKATEYKIWLNDSLPVGRTKYFASKWGLMPRQVMLRCSTASVLPGEGVKNCLLTFTEIAGTPIMNGFSLNVERVEDSSRYFIVPCTNENGIVYYYGIAFFSRDESQQFWNMITQKVGGKAPPASVEAPVPAPSPAPAPGDTDRFRTAEAKQIGAIVDVVSKVANALEEKGKANAICKALDEFSKKKKFGDLELQMENLFTKVMGEDSKTARVFKAIHQNIIFPASYQIKIKITKNMMSKDYSGPEGWQIKVDITKESVLVRHKRREQNLATAPADEHYWYEWEIILVFGRNMSDLHAVRLRICDLGFDAQTRPDFKEKITAMFCGGDMMV